MMEDLGIGPVISNMYLMMNIIALGIILMEDLGIGLVLSNMYRRMNINSIALIKHKNFLIFYYPC